MLIAALENLLNRNLAQSPQARELCAALCGRRLKVVVQDLGLQFGVESLGGSLRITPSPADECHVEVVGSPVNLLALAGAHPERLLQSGAVQVRGDLDLLQRYRDLALLLRPDLEEELARLIGDAPAHRLAGLARAALSFGRRSADTAVRNAAEYFAHETGDLVPRAEAEVFLGEVDRLREDVDRAAARLEVLRRRLEPAVTPDPPIDPSSP